MTNHEKLLQHLSSKLDCLRESASSAQEQNPPELHREIQVVKSLLDKLETPSGRELLTVLFGEEVPGTEPA